MAELADLVQRLTCSIKALDLGFGVGDRALLLARHGFRTTAVDPSEARVRWLQRLAERQCIPLRVQHHDLETYPLRGTYDLIIACEGLNQVAAEGRVPLLLGLQSHTRRGGFNAITLATDLRTVAGELCPSDERCSAAIDLDELYRGWRVIVRQEYLRGASDEDGRDRMQSVTRIIAQRR